ncbi:zinc-binding dehydrogenase [Halomarina halobia]|uniref:Zinc-binding dehydrogenase n=1 Tax=Halomarina halobia TaxID=3033386 RepID=A0ABD6AFZ7_9EURY|nr:zinc-binding dehydrogenase [Halomarina sp. PSR21]
MRASVIPETGGPDVIAVRDVPDPEVGSDDVLIEVRASAVNHTDVWIRRGYEGDPPIVTGIDVAGEVAEVGADVDDLAPGDRVVLYWNTTYCGGCEFCNDGETTMCRDYGGLGVKRDGGHAEYVAVEARHAVELPDHVPFEEAAAVPSNFGTAWRGLLTRAGVGSSDEVLVLGASGGVGHAAVQIAAHAGATVYAASSSAEKAERLRDLGAERVVDYTETAIDDAVADLTGRRGVDVVFESVGGETYEQAVRSLARGGRLVTVGATTGDADQGMLHHVFWKQLEVIGATGATMGEFEDVLGAFFDGDVEPVVDSVISLEEIPAAHERLSRGDGFGKIVVRP